MNLSNLTIAITTFLRPGYLAHALQGLRYRFSECPRVIVCDDEGYTARELGFNNMVSLPFDSGLTAKRNAAVREVKTKYTLMASDDYDFGLPYTRTGVERLVHTLDAHPEVSVVVGTFNRKWYQGYLEYKPGEYIKEHSLSEKAEPTYSTPYPAYQVDIGINYFVARTQALLDCPWDETIRPIGGEHADWFLSLKKQNKKVAWVRDCYIDSLPTNTTWEHSMYREYRRRAWIGHEIFKAKWHIKNYIDFQGNVS